MYRGLSSVRVGLLAGYPRWRPHPGAGISPDPEIPDQGEILLDGRPVHFKRPQDARTAGIETVYQTLAVAPSLDVAANLFLGREVRRKGPLGSVLRITDRAGMRERARRELRELGISTLQDVTVPVENLSGGQRQAVAVARAAAFGSKVVVLDDHAEVPHHDRGGGDHDRRGGGLTAGRAGGWAKVDSLVISKR